MNDYKELIEDLRTYACFSASSCGYYAMKAADAIEQLAKDIDVLTKERDAAVADLSEFRVCKTCKNFHDGICTKLSCSMCSKWEWRGVQE